MGKMVKEMNNGVLICVGKEGVCGAAQGEEGRESAGKSDTDCHSVVPR